LGGGFMPPVSLVSNQPARAIYRDNAVGTVGDPVGDDAAGAQPPDDQDEDHQPRQHGRGQETAKVGGAVDEVRRGSVGGGGWPPPPPKNQPRK